ncbi:COQ9 family protein [Alphaproteobacteria bacterium]|nr:COQ9 family protein [Alphaproteobacteria bacterium]
MTNKLTDNINIKFNLVKAMLSHVPFDGWTWVAMENGAVDINFESDKIANKRIDTYKKLFKGGAIDFIDVFSEIIDLEVKDNYNNLKSKPQRIPEKIKNIILMRLSLCNKYKEAVRSSLTITALPNNSKKSVKILYRTCNTIWRMSGDKSTDFSFYTKRISLAAVYTSTLLFWLNDSSIDQKHTEYFLDRRLNDISKISNFKKPFNALKDFSSIFKKTKNTLKIKSVFDILKKLNQIKKSSFSNPF